MLRRNAYTVAAESSGLRYVVTVSAPTWDEAMRAALHSFPAGAVIMSVRVTVNEPDQSELAV